MKKFVIVDISIFWGKFESIFIFYNIKVTRNSMEDHILQTSRSHSSMIENLFKLQRQQNEVLQQKLNDADKRSNGVKKLYTIVKRRAVIQQWWQHDEKISID